MRVKSLIKRIINDYLNKNNLISLTYLLLFIGVVFLDWSIYSILFSYILEFSLLLLVFVFSHLFTFIRKDKVTTNYNPFDVVIASVLLAIFNYGVVYVVSLINDFDFYNLENNTSDFMIYEILPSSVIIIAVFSVAIYHIDKSKRQETIDQNMIFQGLILSLTNLVAALIFIWFEFDQKLIGLFIILFLRWMLERKFTKKMKLF